MRTSITTWLMLAALTVGCSEEATSPTDQDEVDAGLGRAKDASSARSDAAKTGTVMDPASATDGATSPSATLKFRSDVTAVTRVADALEGTFIPPYRSCVQPKAGETGQAADGKVCTNVAISGATEPGHYFPDYASCDVVRTQRPFWSRPPAGAAAPDDPRLQDSTYLAELGWVKQQIEATGCVCCHDSKVLDGKQAGQWDIELGPLWLDSLSDSGLALFAGLADSSSLGAYPADDNFGFERDLTGIPSTDGPRMQKFMLAELTRRGISEDEARAVPPFGGPIYANRVAKPTPCEATEGVFVDGSVRWKGGPARYVYVAERDSENPGVPPNLDQPAGTLFRLDVLPSAAPVASGFVFGTTPAGSFQALPESTAAAPLQSGQTYHLTVLRDVGLPVANCLFEYGKAPAPVATPKVDAGSKPASADGGLPGADAAAGCALPGGDADGFGAPCLESSECSCAASYCALMPGQTMGYCSKTGCKEDKSICPADYTCFDISQFAPGQPSVCTK
jgi:hypothetical protein